MTQSRGPWLGSIVCLSVASIGRAKNSLRRAVFVIGLGLLVGVPLYHFAKDYVSGPSDETGSERQTAQYRAQLMDNYVPLAKLGGAWGWGNLFPRMGGQDSVDNEFLLVWLVQGYVGLTSLILIFLEAGVSFLRVGIATRPFSERYFVFTLLGILLGFAVCLSTVWLANQSYELFFLLIGWSQSIRPVDLDDRRFHEEMVAYELSRPDSVLVYT